MKNEQEQTPAVLLITFNRLDTTLRVLEAIKLAAPSKLYVASDGPRNQDEARVVEKIRSEIRRAVDWPCNLDRLNHERNLGCREAVQQAVDWFFKNEPAGIILEDDCLPHPAFFDYCAYHLKHQRANQSIATISGTRMRSSGSAKSGSGDLTKFFACWGWASWRESWQRLRQHPLVSDASPIRSTTPPEMERYQKKLETHCMDPSKVSWDYEIALASLQLELSHISPPTNLILNLGFSEQSTHCARRPPNAPTQFGSPSILKLDQALERAEPAAELAFMRTQFQPFSRRWINRLVYGWKRRRSQ